MEQTDKLQEFVDFIGPASSALLSIAAILLFALIAQVVLKSILNRSTSFLTKKELFNNSSDRQKRIKTINSIIGAIVGVSVWSIAILMILDKIGVPIGPIIASAGLVGAVVAFGTQSLIKDFVSGIFIIAENQYHIDDYVDIGSISGKVEAVSVRTTTVRGEDGSLYYVPNGSISITSNKSVGPIQETIKIELTAESNLTDFAKKLATIAENIHNDPETSGLIQEGPTISGVVSVSKKAIGVNLVFKTTASKRKKATSAVWRALAAANKKDTIHLV